MKRFSISTILGLTLGILLAFGVAVSAFQSPQLAPPQGNVPAPLNVGPADQTKTGGLLQAFNLWVNSSLGVTGGATFSGNVGIGTASPAQKLTVAGTIESTIGGFKFPDGSVQVSVAKGLSGVTAFTSSGTFTVPSGVTSIMVEAWGGGGGGGGAGSCNSCSTGPGGGGGGGGGGYGKAVVSVMPGASYSVAVGGGGSRGAGSGSYGADGFPGSAGGTSSFSTLSASGGAGGAEGISSGPGAGGAPGGSTAPFSLSGEHGTDGKASNAGGIGGKSAWGLEGGGNGGASNAWVGGQPGSSGASGRVLLTY